MNGHRHGWFAALPATAMLVMLALGIPQLVAAQARPGETKALAGRDVTSSASVLDSAGQGRRSEYGITLAMSGEHRAAEIVFAALLSSSPGDARALANLGNLRVLNGDLEVALAFYDQALRAAPRDAGIVLNRATALMLMGETDRAETEAARGIALAGGEAEAAKLLGLTRASAARAADTPFVSQQEIRALLHAAKARVPGDSVKASTAADSLRKPETRAKRPTRTWRSAGPRAGDGGDIAAVLYWKR